MDISKRLVDVAMGRQQAELVIRSGTWVSVQSGELLPDTDIAISGERIGYVGTDASHTIGIGTRVIDADGKYLVPGLLDGHLHIESGMLSISEFVRAVLPRGTTGLFIDPHEITNVLGLEGLRMMVDEAAMQPMHVWVQVPSCIPSAPDLETPGADFGPDEVAEALTWPGVIGLGEVMNFPGVFSGDNKLHSEMAYTRLNGKVIGGHYASPDLGLPFHGYVAGGPEDDHEGTSMEDAVARVRQGMKVMMRLGSAWHDVEAQLPALLEQGLDSRHFMLVTDDSHSGTLVNDGHMDRVVRHAISLGAEPMLALQMATINTAEHFGVARDVGQIAPGRFGDVVIVSDLAKFDVDMVIAKGQITSDSQGLTIKSPSFAYPSLVRDSVKLKRELVADDFMLKVRGKSANVIGVIENQAPTKHLTMKIDAENGYFDWDQERDIVKIALVERHRGTGQIQLGLVNGFGLLNRCALGSTVAHDSHHMIIVGTDDESMAVAANELARVGGGQIAVYEGQISAVLELPIAGLMSDQPAEQVARSADKLLEAYRQCGVKLNNANMQLSLLALVVIPELRISDQGIVDVAKFSTISLFDDN
jgi:adenine deaminase